jgi:CBS domain-containing membrane protein
LDQNHKMKQYLQDGQLRNQSENNSDELELTDDDILDAMRHIPGYLDITTEDFRTIYHLAHRHALERMFAGMTASRLMRTSIVPLLADTTLDKAARTLADTGYKGLPVVDANSCVIGMLTETDFLKRLNVDSFLELLLRMFENSFELSHRCHQTTVSTAMTKPAVTVGRDANFMEMLGAFHRHGGRSMPVVESDGRLIGLLLRKDIINAYQMKASL